MNAVTSKPGQRRATAAPAAPNFEVDREAAASQGSAVPQDAPQLNVAQLKMVLEGIATRASTLGLLLMDMGASSDDSSLNTRIYAAQHLAELIGGMADDALGGECFGGLDHWLYGPNFAKTPPGPNAEAA